MSDFIPPNYSKRQLNLQMVNGYVSIHDLMCHCKQPLHHIIKQIEEQEPSIKKCQGSSTAAAGIQDGEDVIDQFGPGELEELFAEDAVEKDG